MAKYRGVLKHISSGESSREANDVTREFIQIGDRHIRNVALSRYMDAVLSAHIGEEVSVVTARHAGRLWSRQDVLAVRTSDGNVYRHHAFTILLAGTLRTVLVTILALVGVFVFGVLLESLVTSEVALGTLGLIAIGIVAGSLWDIPSDLIRAYSV